MGRKKTILAISDYANTGIGESLREPLKHWHNEGHEIWYLGLGYNGWSTQIPRDVYPYYERVMPIMDQYNEKAKFGQTSIVNALKVARPDHVITSYDVGMVRYLSEPHADPITAHDREALEALNVRKRTFSHIAYFPLDGALADGTMPRHFEEIISGFDVPVTYSPFAQASVLKTTGFEIPMIPISHDPKIFRPMDKKKALEAIGFPTDRFIIGMVGTNQSRKLWPAFIEAAGRVAKRHSDVLILPWTTWDQQINGGFDIADLIYRADIPTQTMNPGGAVHRFSDEQMACLYAGIEVLVLTTVGEGAGLPPIRARACGTPALVSDNTSCRDFAAHDFELVKSWISHTDNGNNIVRYATSVDELEDKLEQLYASKSLREEIGQAGFEHSKQFQKDVCNAEWDALLEMI